MHLWVEQREFVDAAPIVRGSAKAADSENSVVFADFATLNGFMIDELTSAGLLGDQEPNP